MLLYALQPLNIITYPRYVHSTPSSRSSFMNPPSEARLNLNPSYVEFDMLITTPKKSYMLCKWTHTIRCCYRWASILHAMPSVCTHKTCCRHIAPVCAAIASWSLSIHTWSYDGCNQSTRYTVNALASLRVQDLPDIYALSTITQIPTKLQLGSGFPAHSFKDKFSFKFTIELRNH